MVWLITAWKSNPLAFTKKKTTTNQTQPTEKNPQNPTKKSTT